jgi:hypothetical protein
VCSIGALLSRREASGTVLGVHFLKRKTALKNFIKLFQETIRFYISPMIEAPLNIWIQISEEKIPIFYFHPLFRDINRIFYFESTNFKRQIEFVIYCKGTVSPDWIYQKSYG